MSKVRVKFNRREIGAILKNDKVREELLRRAERIKNACDPTDTKGYEAVSGTGKTRARAAVIAQGPHARRSNAIHNTLVNNLDAGRG